MNSQKIKFTEMLIEFMANDNQGYASDIERFMNRYKSNDLIHCAKLVFAKYENLDMFSVIILFGDIYEILDLYDDGDTVYAIVDENMKVVYINDDVCEL